MKQASGENGFSFERLLVSAHKIPGPKIVLAHRIFGAQSF